MSDEFKTPAERASVFAPLRFRQRETVTVLVVETSDRVMSVRVAGPEGWVADLLAKVVPGMLADALAQRLVDRLPVRVDLSGLA